MQRKVDREWVAMGTTPLHSSTDSHLAPVPRTVTPVGLGVNYCQFFFFFFFFNFFFFPFFFFFFFFFFFLRDFIFKKSNIFFHSCQIGKGLKFKKKLIEKLFFWKFIFLLGTESHLAPVPRTVTPVGLGALVKLWRKINEIINNFVLWKILNFFFFYCYFFIGHREPLGPCAQNRHSCGIRSPCQIGKEN